MVCPAKGGWPPHGLQGGLRGAKIESPGGGRCQIIGMWVEAWAATPNVIDEANRAFFAAKDITRDIAGDDPAAHQSLFRSVPHRCR